MIRGDSTSLRGIGNIGQKHLKDLVLARVGQPPAHALPELGIHQILDGRGIVGGVHDGLVADAGK